MPHAPFADFNIQKASQLLTKSDQWFEDVQFVFKAKRYAATLYLGGFVVECLLKASLWKRRFEPRIRSLLFSHALVELLDADIDLSRELRQEHRGTYEQFARLSTWTVRIRYNPARIDSRDATEFMVRLREVRQWLRDRIRV